jgi:transcriptional regulator with XRE-family HTH domain
MGRHRVDVRRNEHGYGGGPGWADPYYCDWAVVVGDRIRRLRKAREWSLAELARRVRRPVSTELLCSYSAGYMSRIERGWASAPLYVYLTIAGVLEVDPWKLLGPDDAQREVQQPEHTLLEVLRRLEIEPAEAIARLAGG